jgi:hypothetical protein
MRYRRGLGQDGGMGGEGGGGPRVAFGGARYRVQHAWERHGLGILHCMLSLGNGCATESKKCNLLIMFLKAISQSFETFVLLICIDNLF